ncbi:hypothetical protein [Mangrovimonas spongiae]|uniref:Lipocalin-like domain-containing protein n=1 Tax=Mangrovimonas spongiae TaxID=2494697 RepID=A0A3R9P0I2_9FLAO|nr:hypothetical protein [Mangrovimonas spongiae]RSK41599.1 hypothetical protein EJA19_01615 [Mangrovimonas spongiae]
MKKNLLLLLTLSFLFSCAEKPSNCNAFKTGTFKYTGESSFPGVITRTASSQIEEVPQNGLEVHSDIEWVSDCEYILTYTKVVSNTIGSEGIVGKQMHVTILEANENTFLIHAKSDAIDDNLELIKIE